jgi:hypothetical protein
LRSRATLPSPQPTSSVNRPGFGKRAKKASRWNRQYESCPGARAQRIQSQAFASQASRRVATLPRILQQDSPRPTDRRLRSRRARGALQLRRRIWPCKGHSLPYLTTPRLASR